MSKGPTRVRTAAHIGLGLPSSLGSTQVGGGHANSIRRLDSRSSSSKATSHEVPLSLIPPISSTDGHADTATPTQVTLTLAVAGLWGYSWDARASLAAFDSAWIEGGPYGATSVNPVAYLVGGVAVGGGLLSEQSKDDAVTFQLVDGDGTATDLSLSVRAFLVRRGMA